MPFPDAAWKERTQCAICSSKSATLERMVDVFPIQRCDDCGFLQTAKILRPEALIAFYSDGYNGVRPRQGQQVNAEINIAATRKLGALQGNGQKLLDIGCGFGFFVDRIAQLESVDAAGIELSEAQLAFGKNELGITVGRDISELPERFHDGLDIITCFEVIEHIADPIAFLQQYTKLLKPGGWFIIATDNFKSLPVRAMGDAFPKWIPHQHISLFDPASLQDTMERTGQLELITKISVTPWELLLRAAVYRGTLRRIGGRDFDLEREVSTENNRPFQAFGIRLAFNRFWFSLFNRRNLEGEMMFVAAKRIAEPMV